MLKNVDSVTEPNNPKYFFFQTFAIENIHLQYYRQELQTIITTANNMANKVQMKWLYIVQVIRYVWIRQMTILW